jgi:small conductance mechanosensitive channel
MDFDVEKYFGEIQKLLITHGISILVAILVLFVGLRIIKVIVKTLNKTMEKRGVDESLRPFLISLLSILFNVMLFISVIQMIGIETTSFVAVLASAGLALGLAKKSFDLENIPIPFPQMDVHLFKQN